MKSTATINIIRSNARLMGVLIDNLLSFSRVQKTGMRIAVMDMGKLAGECGKRFWGGSVIEVSEFSASSRYCGYAGTYAY